MTFDLILYRRETDSNMDINQILNEVSQNPNFKVKELRDGFDLFYENKLTGVYFMMDYAPEEEAPNFPGFKKSGLFVYLNYARPTYFALEALPVISGIADSLSLFVLDDQLSSNARTPSKPDPKILLESWTKSNKWGVEAGWTHGETICFMPRDQLDYLWKYRTLTASLQERIQVFVPTKLLAFKDESARVLTCCPWPNYMPQVFPLVDLVLIGFNPAPPGVGLKGFARLSTVKDLLKGIITEVKEPLEYLLLSKELDNSMRKNLDGTPLIPVKGLTPVAWDQLVDVAPPQRAIP